MVSVVGLVGPSRSAWKEHLGVLHAMLKLSNEPDAREGFIALTNPRKHSPRGPRVVTDTADAFVATSGTWSSLPRCSVLVAFTTSLTLTAPPRADGHSPGTEKTDRFVSMHCGARPNWKCVRVPRDTDDGSTAMRDFIASYPDPATGLAAVLEHTADPVTVALIWIDEHALLVARRGTPLWVNRLSGTGGWFLSPSRETFSTAVERVYGPESPLIDVAIPVSDETVVAVMPHGSVCLLHGSTPKSGHSEPLKEGKIL